MHYSDIQHDKTREATLVDVPDAVYLLNVSRSTLYRLIADGSLPSCKVRGSRRFRLVDLERYVSQLASSSEASNK